MIIYELSNYPRERLKKLELQVEREQRAIAAHRAQVAQLRADNAASRRWWQLGLRSKHQRQERELQAREPQPSAGLQKAIDGLRGGIEAEDRMTAVLERGRSDDWTLLRGYTNAAGELDHLLIGPDGVWAIEVKSNKYRMHINGNKWTYEKYDNWDTRVDAGNCVDGRGRSWGRQVSEPAEQLADFLGRRDHPVWVRTAVAMMNDRAAIGSRVDQEVNYVSLGGDDLATYMRDAPDRLDPATCAAVVRLAKRDHEFHAKRRSARNH